MPTTFLIRRGTSADWREVNPTLANGELGYDETEKKLKVGDGVTDWNDLAYQGGGGGAGGDHYVVVNANGALSYVIPAECPFSATAPLYRNMNTRLNIYDILPPALPLLEQRMAPTGKVWNNELCETADGTGVTYDTISNLTVLVNADKTLYIKWVDGYRLTYDANGGTNAPTDNAYYGGIWVVAYAFPASTPQIDYDFVGWCETADGSGTLHLPGDPIAVSGAMTLYAKNMPKVKYDANTGAGTVAATSFANGSWTLSDGQGFTKNGYLVAGWMLTANGTENSYDLSGTITEGAITEPTTLYARWVVAATLLFDANGADAETVDAVTLVSRGNNFIGIEGSTVPFSESGGVWLLGTMRLSGNLPNNLSSASFYSWASYPDNGVWLSIEGELGFVPFSGAGSNISMHWGSVLPPSSSVFVGVSVQIPPLSLTKDGHYFLGWNTQANGEGTMYQPGESVQLDVDMTLYAIWHA